MLPGLTGEEALPLIKEIRVIVVSAKMDIDNRVNLLLGGAVDYITKPFNIKKLLACIAVQFRNMKVYGTSPMLTFKDITLDTDTHTITVCECNVKLIRTEYAILKLLMQNSSAASS